MDEVTLQATITSKANVAGFVEAKAAAEGLSGNTSGGGLTGVAKAHKAAAKEAENLDRTLSHAVVATGQAGSITEGLARKMQALAALGFTPAGVGALALVGGLGLLYEGGKTAIDTFEKLGTETLNYSRVTGESAEVASRQVGAFDLVGISADTASLGMFTLQKNLETMPKHLNALGIAAKTDAQGNLDLNATLLEVADAYNKTSDSGIKSAIVFDAFGRSGRDMVPILEQGRQGIQSLEASVKTVFTQDDLDRVRRYAIHQKEAKENWDAWMASIGRGLSGPLDSFVEQMNKANYVADHMDAAMKANTDTAGGFRGQSRRVADELGRQYDASQKAKEGLDNLAAAHKNAGDAAAAQAKELDDLFSAEMAQQNSALALDRANLRVSESGDKVTKAQDDLNAAVQKYGPQSDQARQAADTLANAVYDQEAAYLTAADAAGKLAEEQLGPGATALDKSQAGHQAIIDKLKDEASTLAPGSPLRVYLDAYIAKLYTIPKDVQTRIDAAYGGVSEGEGQYIKLPRAGGGTVHPGQTYTVGEHGPETLRMGSSGGVVSKGGDGGGTNITINLMGSGDSYETANAIARQLSQLFPS